MYAAKAPGKGMVMVFASSEETGTSHAVKVR
jgi:hypothetical protein